MILRSVKAERVIIKSLLSSHFCFVAVVCIVLVAQAMRRMGNMGRMGSDMGEDEGGTCWGSHWLLHEDGDKLTNRTTEMELPVAVGHGIVHLFLLEELSDGQQLLQRMLGREEK